MKIFFRWKRKCVADLNDLIVVRKWTSVVYVIYIFSLLSHRNLCTAQLPNGKQLVSASRLVTPTPLLKFLPSSSVSALCTMQNKSFSSQPLRSTSLAAICDCLNLLNSKEARCFLENYRLQFCSHMPLSLTEIAFDNSTFCHLHLEKIIQTDERARLDFHQFHDIINRQDCDPMAAPEDKFSVRWKCSDCLDAYKNWLCSWRVLPEVSKEVSPCASTCVRVLQRCPYFVPNVEYQYSGMPVFDCNENLLDELELEEGNESCFSFEENRNSMTNCTQLYKTQQSAISVASTSYLKVTPSKPVSVGEASVSAAQPKNISSLAIRNSNESIPLMSSEKGHNSES